MGNISFYLFSYLLLSVFVLNGVASSLDDCSARELNGICQMSLFPVCGTDHLTYPNKCVLCAENAKKTKENWIRVAHKGNCS
ncbi:turripeptide OL11-like [Clavelina lepadiformis]|uniref:turripeptide OL11-like n=1 Tax=Clavelina lepadiformis TaxID=159417 RepID=UPI00404267A6